MSDVPDQKVSLGCGTLIIIALIVLFFSNAGKNDELERKVDAMSKKLDRIEKLLEKQP